MAKCGYYLEQKRRYCGMSTRAGAGYCLEHADSARERVPCPLDPNHTVAAASLKRHLKKCNKLKQLHQNDDKPWYRPGFNASPAGACVQTPKSDYDPEQLLAASVRLVERICAAEFRELPLQQRQNAFMERTRCQEVVAQQKHAVQQSSLIQHLADRSLLLDSSFVEFGCGRAELSRYINQTVAAAAATVSGQTRPRFVLIDRASNRMKFDSKFATDWQELALQDPGDHQFVRRARVDIRDVWLEPLTAADDGGYVAVSKHLCGVATDLALRALKNSPGTKVRGVCVAMCCRHVCDKRQFVNPEFIKGLLETHGGSSGVEYDAFFDALRKMCSWATSGVRPGADLDAATVARREQLGLMARRIIDEGRVRWVREELKLTAELVKYVEPEVSLENCALIAR